MLYFVVIFSISGIFFDKKTNVFFIFDEIAFVFRMF